MMPLIGNAHTAHKVQRFVPLSGAIRPLDPFVCRIASAVCRAGATGQAAA